MFHASVNPVITSTVQVATLNESPPGMLNDFTEKLSDAILYVCIFVQLNLEAQFLSLKCKKYIYL